MTDQFTWVPFYKELADKLLAYQNDRDSLMTMMYALYEQYDYFKFLNLDNDEWWKDSRHNHIDPFSIFAVINRQIKSERKQEVAKIYKDLFHIEATVPKDFRGIPTVNNLSSFFNDSEAGVTWELFIQALAFAANGNGEHHVEVLSKAFEESLALSGNGVARLTMGLFWVRPETFLPLDVNTRAYLKTYYGYEIDGKDSSFTRYLDLMTDLKEREPKKAYYEIALEAYLYGDGMTKDLIEEADEDFDFYNDRDINYYWLVANPKIWSFSQIGIDETIDYMRSNANGRARNVKKNFDSIKVGDIAIGYESGSSHQQIVCLLRAVEINEKYITFKKIEEFIMPLAYADLVDLPELEHFAFFKNPRGTLFKVEDLEFQAIIDLVYEGSPELNVVNDKAYPLYTEEDFLAEVFMEAEKYQQIRSVLKRKKNIILQGPPGVGKTFAAKRLAYAIMGEKDESRLNFIQFHQNYSYEDFVMGYRATEKGFELRDGKFYTFAKKAENDSKRDYFFIIDEINRGNLSKILGELLMAIEVGYRNKKVELAYKNEKFSVPNNLYHLEVFPP